MTEDGVIMSNPVGLSGGSDVRPNSVRAVVPADRSENGAPLADTQRAVDPWAITTDLMFLARDRGRGNDDIG